jgi:hypothetical protein
MLISVRLCLLCVASGLTACAPMLAMVGSHQSVVQLVAQIERVKLAGDGASYVASSKTITDHALSGVVGKDCKVFNVVTREPVCTEKAASDPMLKLTLIYQIDLPAQATVQPNIATAGLVTGVLKDADQP